MLWGHTLRSPHAHARIVAIDIAGALAMPGVHAVLTHDDVPGAKTVRARVRRPAGARDRSRALLRRAGRARRRGAPRAGAARGGARSSSSTSRCRPWSTRSARPSRSRCIPGGPTMGHGYRDDPRPNVVRSLRHPPRRSRRGGDVSVSRRVRGRHPGSGLPRAGVGPRGARRRGRRRHLRRDAVAARRPRPGRAVPRTSSPSRCGSTSPASAARSAGARTSRCRSTARCSRCTRARPVKIVYSREESFVGHVHRHPARIWAEHRATTRRAARLRPHAHPARRRRLRLELDRGDVERGVVRLRPVHGGRTR